MCLSRIIFCLSVLQFASSFFFPSPCNCGCPVAVAPVCPPPATCAIPAPCPQQVVAQESCCSESVMPVAPMYSAVAAPASYALPPPISMAALPALGPVPMPAPLPAPLPVSLPSPPTYAPIPPPPSAPLPPPPEVPAALPATPVVYQTSYSSYPAQESAPVYSTSYSNSPPVAPTFVSVPPQPPPPLPQVTPVSPAPFFYQTPQYMSPVQSVFSLPASYAPERAVEMTISSFATVAPAPALYQYTTLAPYDDTAPALPPPPPPDNFQREYTRTEYTPTNELPQPATFVPAATMPPTLYNEENQSFMEEAAVNAGEAQVRDQMSPMSKKHISTEGYKGMFDKRFRLLKRMRNAKRQSSVVPRTNATCNSRKLGAVMFKAIVDDVSLSKRLVMRATQLAFHDTKFDVFCATGEFSYSIHSRRYCEMSKDEVTCFAFR